MWVIKSFSGYYQIVFGIICIHAVFSIDINMGIQLVEFFYGLHNNSAACVYADFYLSAVTVIKNPILSFLYEAQSTAYFFVKALSVCIKLYSVCVSVKKGDAKLTFKPFDALRYI